MDKYINLYAQLFWSHLIASFSSNFSWSLFPFTIHGSEFVFLLLNIIFFSKPDHCLSYSLQQMIQSIPIFILPKPAYLITAHDSTVWRSQMAQMSVGFSEGERNNLAFQTDPSLSHLFLKQCRCAFLWNVLKSSLIPAAEAPNLWNKVQSGCNCYQNSWGLPGQLWDSLQPLPGSLCLCTLSSVIHV